MTTTPVALSIFPFLRNSITSETIGLIRSALLRLSTTIELDEPPSRTVHSSLGRRFLKRYQRNIFLSGCTRIARWGRERCFFGAND